MSVRSLRNLGMKPGAALSKHLPGRHDQKSHGNRAGIVLLPGSLGLSRSEMPQVPGALQATFVRELRAEGVSVETTTVNPSHLRPVQARINRTKVARAKAGVLANVTKLTQIKSTISNDNFILDGHHRWIAYIELERKMPVLRVDLDINALLIRAGDFNEKHNVEAKVLKHLGPGDHPSGSPQTVHGKKKFRDIVGVGKPLRYKYKAGTSGFEFWETAAISRNTARQRINALKRLVAERYDLPKDTKVEYWLDWDKYKDNVLPGKGTGMYPMARWEPGNNRVVISPSIAVGMFDDNLSDWRVVTHELMHATSSIGDEFGLIGPSQVLEEGMAEIASLKLWADEFDLQGFADNHRTIDDGLAAMIDNSAYPEHVNNLIMHASDEVGFDRDKMWTWMEDKWRNDGNYTDYTRYQVLDRGLNAKENLKVQITEINQRADALIESLPQHAVEYERSRQQSLTHVRESNLATWQFETTQRFDGVASKARAAGIDLNKMPGGTMSDDTWEIQEQEMKARHGDSIPTREGYARQVTISNSLLYWFLSDG